MKAHAKLGASTSSIWINCPGAPMLWDKAPPKVESAYATEGTNAHDVLEKWLNAYKKGEEFPVHQYDRALIKALKVCVDEVKKLWRPGDRAELVIEKRVDLSNLIAPQMFGTVDVGVIDHFGTLTVIDYKHGRGVKVELVKEYANGERLLNTQIVYYALGLAHEYDFNFLNYRLGVIQPRYGDKGQNDATLVTHKELYSYVDLFKNAVKETMKKNAKRAPGPWCRFCQAKPICREAKAGYRTDSRNDFV